MKRTNEGLRLVLPTLWANGTQEESSSEVHLLKSDNSPRTIQNDFVGNLKFSNNTGNARSNAADSEEGCSLLELDDTSSGTRLLSSPHEPIPATTIFAAAAFPLYLPDLDNFLSHLPAREFPEYTTGVHCGRKTIGAGMFPPMDRLTATGKSIQDLENNNIVLPVWRNRNSSFGALVNVVLGVTGSSAVAMFYSLQGIIDTVQIFALIISSIVSITTAESKWKNLFLGIIPNVLALNFGTTVTQSSLFLGLFIAITGALLYYFWLATNKCESADVQEGFTSSSKDGGWKLIFVAFILSALYLPLSTIVVHALVWSDDFWAVSNPYTNSTVNPPVVAPLGPADQFYGPLGFCYTTTMKRNEFNYAPIIVAISAVTFAAYTLWFPIRLHQVIRQAVPLVDRYTELGKLRSSSEMDREYQRLLERDRHSVTFLYQAFRRGWGTYRSFYLYAKLSALFIIAIINPDNCLFRTLNRTDVSIAQQSVLACAMFAFFLIQCIWAPFVDPVNNASEWMSRLNYVLTSLVGLAVATRVPGQKVIDGPVLYVIYIITYGFSAYFTFVNFSWMHRVIKRLTNRIDFSKPAFMIGYGILTALELGIDIFSPRLDISPHSAHVKRRTWQETVTIVFLTAPSMKLPESQAMAFSQMRGFDCSPYLLEFQGSPAERHVENIKILREIGSHAYLRGLSIYDSNVEGRTLYETIQRKYVGPDMHWKPLGTSLDAPAAFGTAWWIPFPPTLVIRFDDGTASMLQNIEEFRAYVSLNSSKEIRRKRSLRLALRALDKQIVQWPYKHRKAVGTNICCCCRRYTAQIVVHYKSCVFNIKRKGHLIWKDCDLGSGFDIELVYAKGIKAGMDILGVGDDWELSPTLARFLALNEKLISERIPTIERAVHDFQETHFKECAWKARVLSYRSLVSIYDRPQEPEHLAHCVEDEADIRVRDMVLASQDAYRAAFERFGMANSSRVAAWWYIFWDDFWRRNHDTVKELPLHSQDFNPYYPTSISYNPLPRPALETFLVQRGLYNSKGRSSLFTTGFLNKIYFRLNEIVFHDSKNGITFHMGEGSSELRLSAVDAETHARTSSLGTGGGTDHDDSSIRARPNYRWEGILEDPLLKDKERRHRAGWVEKMGVWLGVTPLWRTGVMSRGLALDVKLQDGRYVLM